jgi:predicted nucleotidyltransferase
MIYLSDDDKQILFKVLSDKASLFYAFGSRVKGTQKQFSDLDLVHMGDLSELEIADIKEQLENSNISIKIDVVNYNDCSDGFKAIIDAEKVSL